jgi:anti-anti-sigma factor
MTTQIHASAPDRSAQDVTPRVPILRLSELGSGLVAVAGEVDIDTAPLFEDRLLALAGPIRLDMRAVTFIDSSGVRALVRMHDHCERDGRVFSVQVCSPPVERLLQSLGLHDVLTEEGRGQLVATVVGGRNGVDSSRTGRP